MEVDRTFHSLPDPAAFPGRRDTIPPAGLATKGSRFTTHHEKPNDLDLHLADFFALGLLKLGRVLLQLPGNVHIGLDRTSAG